MKTHPDHYYMTYQEIADKTGVTEFAVWETEKRALRKLKNGLIELGYFEFEQFSHNEIPYFILNLSVNNYERIQ